MADSLPSNGSNLKMKTKNSATMSMSSTQTNVLSVENQNDQTKNKKCQSVRSEKLNKQNSLSKESTTNGLVAPLSSIRKPTSRNEHQQQKSKQTQCQHQNMNKQKMRTTHQEQQMLMDLQEIDDLRKKRCTDRFDSSESSDSGVATLSITDSSATSSEDTSNPDSPDNNAINTDLHHHSSNGSKSSKQNLQVPNNNNSSSPNKNKQETECNAPPLAWPWNVSSSAKQQNVPELTNTLPSSSQSKSSILSENKTNCGISSRNKRNHTTDTGSQINNKRNRSSTNVTTATTSESESTTNDSKRTNSQNNNGSKSPSIVISGTNCVTNGNALNIRSQTKITGFFKTQMKALPSLRKDLINTAMRPPAISSSSSSSSQQLKDDSRILVETTTAPSIDYHTTKSSDTLPALSLLSNSNGSAKKVERRTATVSPMSRKPNSTKKSYMPPKKHVNIAPRTNATTMTVPTMVDTIKSQQMKVLQSVAHQQKQQEQQHQQHHHQDPQQDSQSAKLNVLQSDQTRQTSNNLAQAAKTNGAIYQLHPTPVIQIPVASKDTNSQTVNNILLNNGYIINGALIKLQQMIAPTATGVDQQFHHRQMKDTQPQSTPNLTAQQLSIAQKPAYAQQPNIKIAPASTARVQDSQPLTNHTDLTQHFVTNGPSNTQFAQPVFIPTSSGLLLTAALPTVLPSQISNLQPISQPQMTLHSVSEKPQSIAVSIEKRSCINMQIPQQTLAVTLPTDNNMQSNFLPNNFSFIMNAAAAAAAAANVTQAMPMNSTFVGGDKTAADFNRSNLLSTVTLSQPFNTHRLATTTPSTLSLPVSFSLSAPSPLCVQSKDMVQSTNHLNLSNSHISYATNKHVTVSQLTNNVDSVVSKISNGCDAGASEAVNNILNHDNKVISKTIDKSLDTLNLTDSLSTNISTKQISSVRDNNDLKTIPALFENIQPDKKSNGTNSSSTSSNSNSNSSSSNSNSGSSDDSSQPADACVAVADSMVRTTELDKNLLSSISIPECSKSPILTQPKTIRFSPNGSRNANGTRTSGCCYWDDCNENCETSSNLLDHLQTKHVNPQMAPFSCRWANCKVHGRESCSRKWLERHVLSHGGSKLFKCIFEKCRMRFGSQLALQKHVNGHINNSENKESTTRRSSDPPVLKKLRVNGKRLRYRRQPFSARMFDYFDNGVMEELQHRLLHTVTITNGVSEAITFKGRSIGRRVTANGSVELLIKWTPNDIISDEWMSANKPSLTKTVQITALTQSERISLMDHLNYLYKFPTNILPSSSISSSSSNSSDNFTSGEIIKKTSS